MRVNNEMLASMRDSMHADDAGYLRRWLSDWLNRHGQMLINTEVNEIRGYVDSLIQGGRDLAVNRAMDIEEILEAINANAEELEAIATEERQRRVALINALNELTSFGLELLSAALSMALLGVAIRVRGDND